MALDLEPGEPVRGAGESGKRKRFAAIDLRGCYY
jgi:hypothetical protein